MANENEKGTATQGVKPNGNGDPYAHRGPVREKLLDTDGMMGARRANSEQPGKPQPSASQVRKDDPDPYGVV